MLVTLPLHCVQTQDKLGRKINNWDSTYVDSALLLDLHAAQQASSPDDNPYRTAALGYVDTYVQADGSDGVTCAACSCLLAGNIAG